MFSSTPSDSYYENPSSNSCFLMNFPSSLLNDSELLFDQLLHHQSPPYDSINNTHNPISTISVDSSKGHTQKEEELGHDIHTTTTKTATKAGPPEKRKRVAGAGVVRRRTGKKDRHSKIYTAQGPRDRRMRLSLQIARKFFDLQDVLGFDKASKTIEWLFSKSKPAIKELTSSLPPHQRKGSLVISHSNNNNNNKVLEDLGGVNEPKITRINSKPVARESREKARARARQRTIEKKKQKELLMLKINPNYNNNNNNMGSSSTPDEEELNSTTLEAMDFHSQPQQSPLENQMSSSVSMIEKLLGSDSSASSSSIYDECSYLGFNGNWVSESLRMYPSYGVDELQVILQQQNPNPISSQSSSGMQFQSP